MKNAGTEKQPYIIERELVSDARRYNFDLSYFYRRQILEHLESFLIRENFQRLLKVVENVNTGKNKLLFTMPIAVNNDGHVLSISFGVHFVKIDVRSSNSFQVSRSYGEPVEGVLLSVCGKLAVLSGMVKNCKIE